MKFTGIPLKPCRVTTSANLCVISKKNSFSLPEGTILSLFEKSNAAVGNKPVMEQLYILSGV